MDNRHFSDSFGFMHFSFKGVMHTDNSAGIYSYFIARMVKGRAHIITENNEELDVNAGDIFFLPIGLRYHSYWYPDDGENGSVEWDSFRFTIFPDKSSKRYYPQIVEADEKILGCIERLCADMSVSLKSVGILYELLGEILPKMKESSPDERENILERARRYMFSPVEFSVPELAKYCNMSESGLYAFFKSYANTTPIEMKNKIRVEKAIMYLASTDLSIDQISDRIGFKSTAYFRKIVKEQTGKTPTQIRREQFRKNSL